MFGNVEKIGAGTFYNCDKLTTLMLSSGITADKVASDAFGATEFTYDKAQIATSPDASSTITIEYVYEDGSSAGPKFEIKDLPLGEKYSRNTPAVEGYTADVLTVSGVASGKNETVKVTYKKNAPEPEQTVEQTTAEEPEEPAQNNYVAIIIMVAVIVGICVAAFFIIRADKKNTKKPGKKK